MVYWKIYLECKTWKRCKGEVGQDKNLDEKLYG